jgi:hypothetical protein
MCHHDMCAALSLGRKADSSETRPPESPSRLGKPVFPFSPPVSAMMHACLINQPVASLVCACAPPSRVLQPAFPSSRWLILRVGLILLILLVTGRAP